MNSPLGDAEESSIREIIAQYYSVVHAMIVLRDFVSEQPGIENTARENVLSQLRFLESERCELLVCLRAGGVNGGVCPHCFCAPV